MRRQLMAVTVALGALVVAPACATKGFVRESVGDVNEKVGTMGKSLEETQERVKQNEQKISEVDGKAAAAGTAAGNAQKAADAAAGQAQAAQAAGKQADARAAALEAETRKLILETVISEDELVRIEFALRGAWAGATGYHLHGGVVVVEQPAVDVDLVDRRVGESAGCGEPVRREGIAVHVVHDERLANARKGLLQCDVARIEPAHEAQGDQAVPQIDLGVDDRLRRGHGRCQGLLAESGPLGVEAQQRLLGVERVGRRDDDRVAGCHELLDVRGDVRPEFICQDRGARVVRVVEPGHLSS